MASNNRRELPRYLVRDELINQWNTLYNYEADGDLVSEWVRYLPENYAEILPSHVSEWLWSREDLTTIPESLEGEARFLPNFLPSIRLSALNTARQRALQLGYSVEDYALIIRQGKRYQPVPDESEYFFAVKRDKDGILKYNREWNALVKITMLDTGALPDTINVQTASALSYCLQSWVRRYMGYIPACQ